KIRLRQPPGRLVVQLCHRLLQCLVRQGQMRAGDSSRFGFIPPRLLLRSRVRKGIDAELSPRHPWAKSAHGAPPTLTKPESEDLAPGQRWRASQKESAWEPLRASPTQSHRIALPVKAHSLRTVAPRLSLMPIRRT